ncbi:lipase family protein [Acaricomes phytoseiuli]|uniref:lipase family protein n=1 Tax=Acaricomes phytoseiuli TaxID=291968 RepID=UPI00222221A8|nr:lipase family protein [Acaricomes phytoseiuli]MCW1250631.1 lipase family protein [Acaricomes phytoseiuli]
MLDVARDAQKTGLSGLSSSTPVMLAGYSQGGEATAAASELAASYTPELNVLGAYAGAVPADLGAVAKFLDGGFYNAFLMSAVSGVTNAYNIDIIEYANAAGMAALAKNNSLCTLSQIPQAAFQDTSKYTKSGQKLSQLIASTPELRKIVDEQTIGRMAPKKFPVLIAQSELDDVIPAGQARDFARQWCQGGATVQYASSLTSTHVAAAVRFQPEMFSFLSARAAGLPSINNCGGF